MREVLSGSFLFAKLEEKDLDALLELSARKKLDAEQVVFTRKSPADRLYAVVSGRVRVVSYSDSGNEIIFRILEPGDVFGEIGVLDGEARTATAIASETSELLVVERGRFLRFLEKQPKLALDLLSAMAGRLRTTTRLLEDTLFLNVPARLARKLLDLAETYGKETPAGTRIEMKLPQEVIGNLIGTSRVSVNQQMKIWKERGWISVERSFVTLIEGAQLERVAEDGDADEG